MSKRAEKAAMGVLPDYPLNGNIKVDLALYRLLYQRGYEQAEKDTIERAMEWLFSNVRDYLYCCVELGTSGITSDFFSDFKKAMEEE